MSKRLCIGVGLIVLAGACEKTVVDLPITLPPADAGFPVFPDAHAPAPDALPMDADPPDGGFVRPDAGSPTPDGGFGPQACAPALSIAPETATALPLGLLTFVGQGGTGDYLYELSEDRSGAILNERSGAYLAGETALVADTVVLHDTGCVGTATATVRIVTPLIVRPLEVELPAGSQFQFEVTSGSGNFGFTIASGDAMGQILGNGVYTAGASEGSDVVRIRDVDTGEERDAVVNVVAGARLRPVPPIVAIPVGSTFAIQIDGGSNEFDVTSNDPAVAYADGMIAANAAARAQLSVRDRFTGQTARIIVEAAAAHTITATRSTDYAVAGSVRAIGDVDGDGWLDAVVGWAEADIAAVDGGAVFVYRGGPNGLAAEPARTIAGTGRFDHFGRAVAVADYDNDGLLDLAVGAIRADVGARDNGGVFIYSGVAGALFSPTPTRTLGGPGAYDYFGYSVEACDFNGDGFVDLAVGGWLAEDRQRRTRSNDQGGVFVHLGSVDGFLDAPTFSLFGDTPNGDGTFSGVAGMRLGWSLASGDIDGDGQCDLVAGTASYRAAAGGNNDGLVYVYRGVAADASGNGGVTDRPVAAWSAGTSGDRGSEMGRYVAVGDIDGDQRAEIAVTQWRHDLTNGQNREEGAVRIFRGRALPDTPITEIRPEGDADWLMEGINDYDDAGFNVQIADLDGDLLGDVLIGTPRGEVDGGPGNTGIVEVYYGRTGMLPDPTAPDREIGGERGEDWFGAFFDVVGDIDRDGLNDLVIIGLYEDFQGINVGSPYFVPGDFTQAYTRLDLPGVPAGYQNGRGFAVVGDLNDDGFNDMATGAALADFRDRGVNTGAVYVYGGTATGFTHDPVMVLSHFLGHSGGDSFGWAVADAGDFDGDGIDDLAVISRNEDKPNTFNASYVTDGADCAGRRDNSGAVYIFLGTSGGWTNTEPAFVWYGPQANDYLWSVAGGFDFDGDGFGDFVSGSREWDVVVPGQPAINNAGGFAMVRGRARDPQGRLVVLCDSALTYLGHAANDWLGFSTSKLGDVDADGCDEIAVGAPLDDRGQVNQGSVRIIFGWGATCARSEPAQLYLQPGPRNSQSGYGLDGGHDVDGDSVLDLVAGGVGVVSGIDTVGGAWLISGEYLATLAVEPLLDQVPPMTAHPLTDPNAGARDRIEGTANGERAGTSVALVPGAGDFGLAAVAVGQPFADFPGVALAGGIRVYRYETQTAGQIGFDPLPIAAMSGETDRPDTELGNWVSAGIVNGRPVLVGAGIYGSGAGLDQGAAYTLQLGP